MSTSESSGGADTASRSRAPRALTYERKLQLTGIVLALVAVAYAKTAIGYGVGISNGTVEAGVLPFALGGLLLVLSVLLIFTRDAGRPADPEEAVERRRELREAAKFFAALLVYVALVTLVGFAMATLLGATGTLRFVFNYSYRRAVMYGAGLTVLLYLLFTSALGVQLP